MSVETLYKHYISAEKTSPNESLEVACCLEPNLAHILSMSKKIRRHVYEDYDKGIIRDNVFDHVQRSVSLAKLLPLSDDVRIEVIRTILLHDLPEVVVLTEHHLEHDLTAPEKKANPKLASEVEQAELQKAEEIFSPADLELYNNFENVGNFIKSKVTDGEVKPSALIAYIVDKIDANILWHQSFSKWAKSDEYDADNLPPDISLTYTFEFGEKFQERLFGLENDEFVSMCLDISKATIQLVKNLWKGVPSDRIPGQLFKYLN